MDTERSPRNAGAKATDSIAARRFGPAGTLLATAGAILLLGGCVAYEREDHYHHGRKGWGPHHYNHMDGHHHREGRYR